MSARILVSLYAVATGYLTVGQVDPETASAWKILGEIGAVGGLVVITVLIVLKVIPNMQKGYTESLERISKRTEESNAKLTEAITKLRIHCESSRNP